MNETGAPPRPFNPWLLVAVVFAVAWIVGLVLFLPLGSGPSMPADFAWTLRDLDDQPVEFKKYAGKPIFLNIWATWCGPCVAEMPSIARLAANPRLKDVAFVCASVDDSPETVKRFLADKNWPMTILRSRDRPGIYYTDGIPATFIIAPDGRIVSKQVGSMDWDTPEIVAMLEKMTK